ncbi:hypothetical protein PsYK624_060200 [Phanerochaete sordida]|uniref:Uncharacterized protein n=1 Tax=Phanerochaete sordida TaxID=48140 RepID=A0A9P3LD32_9APHY|nr:hypothetical protein PsYK624_060200 [Phanerochaete sordida]
MPTEYTHTHRRHASDASPNLRREGRPLAPSPNIRERTSRERTTDTRYRRAASPAGPRGLVSQNFLERSAAQMRGRTTSAGELRLGSRASSRDGTLDGTRYVSYQYRAAGQGYVATAERREDIPETQPPRVRRDVAGQPVRYQGSDTRSGLRPLALAQQYPQSKRTPSDTSLRQPSNTAQPAHVRSAGIVAWDAPRQVPDSRHVHFDRDPAASHRRTFSTPDPRFAAMPPVSAGRSTGVPPSHPSGSAPAFMNMPPNLPEPARAIEQHPVAGATVSRSASSASSVLVNRTQRMTLYDMPSTTRDTATAVNVTRPLGHSASHDQPQKLCRSPSGHHLRAPPLHRPDVPSIAREFSSDSATQEVAPFAHHMRRTSEQGNSRVLPSPPAQAAPKPAPTDKPKRSPSYRKPVPTVSQYLRTTQPSASAPAARQPARKNPSQDSLESTTTTSSTTSFDLAQLAQLRGLLAGLDALGVSVQEAHARRNDSAFLARLASATTLTASSHTASEESLPRTPAPEAHPRAVWVAQDPERTPTKAAFARDATRAPRVRAEDLFADAEVDKSLPPTPARTSPVEGKAAVQRNPLVGFARSQPEGSDFASPHLMDAFTPGRLEDTEIPAMALLPDVGYALDTVSGILSPRCNYMTSKNICGQTLRGIADWESHRASEHNIMPDRNLVCGECATILQPGPQTKATHVCDKPGLLKKLLSSLSFVNFNQGGTSA